MKVLTIILGVLLIIGGLACMFTPLMTVLAMGYILGIFLFIYGIAGIVRAISERGGALVIVISILAILVGLYAMVRPGGTLALDAMILIIIGVWIILQGIMSIVVAIQRKKLGGKCIGGVIIGIIGIVIGVYCFAHPAVLAVATGILIGLFFAQSGFDLIALASMAPSEKKLK